MKVLFLASGVYPHYKGGVSTWAHLLISGLKNVRFILVSVVSNPHVQLRYDIPKNVEKIITLPLWGSDRPEEYSKASLKRTFLKNLRTNDDNVRRDFIPHFEILLEEIASGGRNPRRLGSAIYGMHQFFRDHDYNKCFRSKAVWESFRTFIQQDKIFRNMTLFQMINTCRTIERLLKVLTIRIPKVDLCHSAIAGVAGLLGVTANLEHDTPYILTEHGIYYRERLLDLINQPIDLSTKIFWSNFYYTLVKLNYFFAEKIYPVCIFNSRWEKEFGISEDKLEVIYNGVDPNVFRPMNVQKLSPDPAVTAVIRIDRLKDALNLITAMKYVKRAIPSVKCFIFGPVMDEDYFQLCLTERKRLRLEEAVTLMGFTEEPEKAYNMGDVVALSSVSEGFPFALIEAMSCGKAVVATDVGGVNEALEDCGLTVPPRAPKLLGEAIVQLLKDEELRGELGAKARKRINQRYSVEGFLNRYQKIYSIHSRS